MTKRLTLLIAALTLIAPISAHAATYKAAYAAPDADWTFTSARGPYAKTAFGTTTTTGHYNAWSTSGSRFDTPDNSISLNGNTLTGNRVTSNPVFHLRIRTGIGANSTSQLNTTSDGSFTKTLSGSFDWVQSELATETETDTSSTGGNHFALTSATLTLSDSRAPALSVSNPGTACSIRDSGPMPLRVISG